MSNQNAMILPANEPKRYWSATGIGSIVGLVAGIFVTGAAYMLEELSLHVFGPDIHRFFASHLEVVVFPGSLLTQLFGLDVYRDYSNELTQAAVSLVTAANALLGCLAGLSIGWLWQKRRARLAGSVAAGGARLIPQRQAGFGAKKGLIVGFFAGALFTLLVHLLIIKSRAGESGPSGLIWCLAYVYMAVFLPTRLITYALGWEWSIMAITSGKLLLMVFTNGVLSALVGYVFVGCWVRWFEKRKVHK